MEFMKNVLFFTMEFGVILNWVSIKISIILKNLKIILGWDLIHLNLLVNLVGVMENPLESQSNYSEIF